MKNLLLIIAVILSVIFIAPTANDSMLYVIYFIFFIGLQFCTVLFVYIFKKSVGKLRKFRKSIDTDYDPEASFFNLYSDDEKINKICVAYKETFIDNPNWKKTRSNADLYFGADTWMQDVNSLPIAVFLKIMPGTFIGFGILGTFIGFSSGIGGIDFTTTDVQVILDGVHTLLNGIGSAFATSIVGVVMSVLLNFLIIHPNQNELEKLSKETCDKLDSKFYITEIDALMQYSVIVDENNRKMPFSESLRAILDSLKKLTDDMNSIATKVGENFSNLGYSIENIKATEFNQVLKAVQKSLGKAIDDEIEKLKITMQTNISSLQECEQALKDSARVLQNAPDKLRDAVDKLINNSEDTFEEFVRTVQKNINDKFDSYADRVQDVSEEMLNIKNTLMLLPNDFREIENSIGNVTMELHNKEEELHESIEKTRQATEASNNLNEILAKSYTVQINQFETILDEYRNVLANYEKANADNVELIKGFIGLDERIAGIFHSVNVNTEEYAEILGKNLAGYLKQFSDSTEGVSKKFADATLALSEEISKLNKKK